MRDKGNNFKSKNAKFFNFRKITPPVDERLFRRAYSIL